MNVIETHGAGRRYQSGTLALDKVSLSVPEGSVYGLLGRNGAGKSTLIKLLMALMHPTEGEVRVFGQDPWSDHAGIKSRIGYISEDQIIPPYLKIADVFAFYSECYKTWDKDMAEKLRSKFKLSRKRKIQKLSKGQKRQVGLICAFSHHPELLILDEPAGGLDAVSRRELLEMVIELLNEQGSTVFFSSHHLNDVERIANRVGILHEGKCLLESSLDDLRENHCRVMLPLGTNDIAKQIDKLPQCISIKKGLNSHVGIFSSSLEQAKELTKQYLADPNDFQGSPLNLEDAFIALVGGSE